jgi:hypothetical protein
MEINRNAEYVIMGDWLEGLKNLEKELYSEQRMGGDKMRDWGNWLNQGFFGNLYELQEGDAY